MYKALTSFAVTGAASTVGAALLDWKVWRGQGGGRGGYGMMLLPEQQQQQQQQQRLRQEGGGGKGGRWTKSGGGEVHKDGTVTHVWDDGVAAPDGFAAAVTTRSKSEQRAGVGVGALWDGDSRGLTRPWKASRTIEVEDFGYKVPEEQTTYAGERGTSMDICER